MSITRRFSKMAVLFTIGLQAWTGCFSIPGNRYAAFYAQGGTMRHQIIELDCDYSRAGIGAPQQKSDVAHLYIGQFAGNAAVQTEAYGPHLPGGRL